ncbi:glycosyltransferase [Cellulomonas sp. JH27-2]|uniref:glycosyltransferase n=1 Tax=Cellulomonas sp. JH27-2 TaxID=2774139 RepID=UPI00177F8686|nr:glycosyltransferase [Cellulomonas sp. JH27-2]MBD8060442.1 glycosyltransferase [Cellulomonas sp. JH27-2]
MQPLHLMPSGWLEHVPFAFWLAATHRPTTFVELGTHYGVSYFAFCQALDVTGQATRCFAVDAWKGDEHAGAYGPEVFRAVRDHNERLYSRFSTLMPMLFDDGLEFFADGEIDLLHIDGYHTYEAARHDFESWLPKLSRRAVVVLHDTNERKDDFGAFRFADELRSIYPVVQFSHGHGLTVVAVGPDQNQEMQEFFRTGHDGAALSDLQKVFGRLGKACAQDFLKRSLEVELRDTKRERDRLKSDLEGARALVGETESERGALERAIIEREATFDAERLKAESELATARQNLRVAARSARTMGEAARAAKTTLSGRDRELAAAKKSAAARKREIAKMKRSTSWRLTAPLRAIARAVRRPNRRRDATGGAGAAPRRSAPARPNGGAPSAPVVDARWYMRYYPDVAVQGLDAVTHYAAIGAAQKRHPNPDAFRRAEVPAFDADWYLKAYPDVAKAGMDPVVHYSLFGRREKRSPVPTALPVKRQAIRRSYQDWDREEERDFLAQIDTVYQQHQHEVDRALVSVVMPTYNRSSQIADAVRSVIAQSHANLELLVVDDGSTDDTEAVVTGFADPRVRYLRLAKQGVSSARNAGLAAAKGTFVAYLDSDNTWTTDHLRHLVTFLVRTGSTLAYCGLRATGDEGAPPYYRGAPFDYEFCLDGNYVDLNAVVHRRLDDARYRFDRELRRLVDWDYLLSVTRTTGATFLPFVGVNYYAGSGFGRITSTEHQGDALRDLAARIQARHALGRGPVAPARAWRDALAGGAALLGDEHSAPFEAADARIDWSELAGRSRVAGRVSVVVLGFDNYDLTRACVRSVLEHPDGRDLELVVVDNGSSDGSHAKIVEEFGGRTDVVPLRLEQNVMFSAGNNAGFAASSGEVVVFLNNDTIVTEGWLDGLVEPLRLDPTVGMVGPKLLYEDGTVQCCGIVFSAKSHIPYHVYQGHAGDAPEVNKARVHQALTGACIAMRATDFVELRGLDPAFINGCEDLDLAFRLRAQLRLRALYNPASVVYHLESRSSGRGRFIARNRAGFVARWAGAVVADDAGVYAEDGFRAVSYVKAGSEADGPTALYRPVLEPVELPRDVPDRVVNIGFSSIWHTRGVSIQTKQITDAIESPTLRTHIFARWESDRFENAGAVEHPRVLNAGDDPTPAEMLAWVRDNEIDCVVFIEVHPNDWKRVSALKAAGVEVVCYENLDVLRTESLHRYDVFDTFLCASYTARERLLRRFPSKRVILVPWASDISVPDQVERPADEIRFVHVGGWGGLNNRKNTDMVIRAFDAAAPSSAKLFVYSQVSVDKYGDEIAEICRTNPAVVVIEGTVPEISEAYAGKDVLLWPSKREGVGLPIIEALACGLTVVVSDGYMMRQWIVPDEHGLVCAARPRFDRMTLPEMIVDEASLVETIRTLANDPGRVHELKAAVARDRALWTWEWQRDVLARLLRERAVSPLSRPSELLEYVPEELRSHEARRRSFD